MRIAINGFGRIGKNFLRALMKDKKAKKNLEVVVINTGKGDPKATAYDFKYDTLLGEFKGDVEFKNNKLYIDKFEIQLISELDPEKISWKKYDIDWVVECSGKFTNREGASKHLSSGAKAVLISAPAQSEDITIIPGVNLNLFNKKKHKIVSLGSCTTNALVPMLKVLNDNFKIKAAFMTTIHAYTNSQVLLDVDASLKDLRKNRAAALNIIPTTTGAMSVVDRIIPEISGKIKGCALRVPVGKVSIIDLVAKVQKNNLVKNEVNKIFKKASLTSLKGILEYTEEPLVSSDFSGNSHSVIIDSIMTEVQDDMIKLFGWYDNEWGYSERLKDFLINIL